MIIPKYSILWYYRKAKTEWCKDHEPYFLGRAYEIWLELLNREARRQFG